MGLQTYRDKRRFGVTAEPRGRKSRKKSRKTGHLYVVQKHAARRLHYDFRLEHDGVLKSWAVTKGPSLVPGEKRLAVQVEDHPLDYGAFEGTIPKGQYGGGTVMLWDRGTWTPEGDADAGFRKGQLTFDLDGEKLKGRWHLVRMRPRPKEKQEAWLLFKGDDAAARAPSDPDILVQKTRSVATRRSLDEIAAGERPLRSSGSRAAAAKPARAAADAPVAVAGVTLTHPDRVYWDDAGVTKKDITKKDLAEFYADVWDRMAPHVVRRPLALLRCPDGVGQACFMQKHAHATFDRKRIVSVDDHGEEIIAIEDLAGLVALVQVGVLEVHVWGTTIDRLDRCDRLVFDLDPGSGVDWPAVIAAAREVHDRLQALGLDSFVKTSGGKGLHIVVPIAAADWDAAKAFTRQVTLEMAADSPKRYVAKMSKSLRAGRIFIDYLRNARGATAVAAYSSRARSGAPVSTPVAWSELEPALTADKFTVLNLRQRLARLRQDPWAGFGKVKQKLPDLARAKKR